jgi:hypothetical protein
MLYEESILPFLKYIVMTPLDEANAMLGAAF